MNINFKILDCTLRDGGYYNSWDFSDELVNSYTESLNKLPVDYVEVGYRSVPLKGYLGKYYYLPIYVLEQLGNSLGKKLAIMLNHKDFKISDIDKLLKPCVGLVSMVRIAANPNQMEGVTQSVNHIKNLGFEVALNVMYMSKWETENKFLDAIQQLDRILDYFYMVDSYGGIYPNDVKNIIRLVRNSMPSVPLGFHGHNNLELALVNTLTALEEGCTIIDSTITGMGRGAGNTKTELILTSLNAKGLIDVDFNILSTVVDSFKSIQEEYGWGTNLPYMVSGAYSLPQKEVMDWVGKRYYSCNSIIRALKNKAMGIEDNEKFEALKYKKYEKAIVIGGGKSVKDHIDAINIFLVNNPDILVIHSSSKNASGIGNEETEHIFCLVGNEGYRMERVFGNNVPNKAICVLPPYPRKMGTYIPKILIDRTFEVNLNPNISLYTDSHTSIALNVAMYLGIEKLYLVGYDGYGSDMTVKEQELFTENSYLFEAIITKNEIKILSLTETKYNLPSDSIYSIIQ